MNELFLKIINMSISASWLILAVLILRLVLKKAPKWVNVLLWGIVAVRLICPFSFESALSLIPSAETFPEKVISGPSFDIQTGISPVDNRINDYLGDRYFEGTKVMRETLLGKEASFPSGPFLIASRLNVPVVFVYVMKEANLHYHLYTRQSNAKHRDEKALLKSYTESLESMLKKYPLQWFNYFDFWK